MNGDLQREVRQAVAAARGRADVRAAVDAIYAQVAAAVDDRKPRCDASGRCCRFEEYGHRLYVTTIELAVFADALRSQRGLRLPGMPLPLPPVEGGGEGDSRRRIALHTLRTRPHRMDPSGDRTLPQGEVEESGTATSADEAGACRFQVDGLCSVHPIRPFGCRMFYCDPSAEQWQQEQYERFHAMLKREHERLGVAYAYVEWRAALSAVLSAES